MDGAITTSQANVSSHVMSLNATTAGAPEWLHILPVGTFKGSDGRGPYVVTDMNALVSLFQSEGRKLPVDENHSTDLAAKKGFAAPARGWIVAFEARDDGLWGKVEWTPEGRSIVEGGSYGHLSPVFTHAPKPPYTVQKMLRVALTNDPNLNLTALHAAQKGSEMDNEQLLEALRGALGLAADADSTAILDGVKKLTESRNSADPAQFVPIAMFQQTVAELHKLRSGVSLQAAETIVTQAVQNGQILPFMKDWAVSLCQTNKSAFDDFLTGATGGPVREFISSLHTKYDFSHSKLDAMSGDTPQTNEVNRNLGHTAEDVKTYGAKA